jgi:uncharacterized peroxidase-related enzyme
MGRDDVARALVRDYREADLAPADRAMLDYAVHLTRSPHAVTAQDVEGLRQWGFSDTAILDICQVTAYYAYVNRLADGLGIELEEHWGEVDLLASRAELRAWAAARAGKGG